MNGANTTRILLADDHPMVRRGVRSLLETREGWHVCGDACSGSEAIEQVKRLKPDIVIMDISMPGMRGFEAVRQVHDFDPNIGILMLTMHDSKDIFCGAIEAGAHAYVLKSDLDEKLIEAVEALCENRAFFSPNISTTAEATRLMEGEDAANGGEAGSDILTQRQLEVLKMLAMGKSNKEVASALGISTRTAETHRYQIMNRLRIRTLSELVMYAIRHHVVEV